MPTQPIQPLERSIQVQEIQDLVAPEFNPNPTPPPQIPTRQTVDRRNLVRDFSETSNRIPRSGVTIIFVNGNHKGRKLSLGTDVQKISQSQQANWSDKDGQKMRSGINFNNISPRQISFTCDLYHPSQDITPAAENIAHLQEISEGTGNEPPLVTIQIGNSIYDNAVCTDYKCDYEDPLPDIKRGREFVLGGFHRAKVNLSFKVPGGVGNQYQFASPFSETTELQGLFDEQDAQERAREGFQRVVENKFSNCLNDAENAEITAILESERLGDPSVYQTMSSEIFLQLAGSGLPSTILNDGGYQTRLKRELANKVASELVNKQGFTNEQISNSLVQGQNLVGFVDFNALLVNYSQVYNAIVNNQINDLDQAGNDLLSRASKCGRSLRDSGGLSLVAESTGVDPAFTTANLNKLLKTITVPELRTKLNLGRNVSDQTINDIKKHRQFEDKDEFIDLVAQSTDGTYGYSAWASFEESEKAILADLNTFLSNAADADEVRSRLKGSNALASALLGQTFTSKEDFLRKVLSVVKPKRVFTFDDGLRFGDVYWNNFQQ